MRQTGPEFRIRPERPDDISAIHAVTQTAFEGAAHSSGTEARIVDALRESGALTLSLVAITDETVVGHIAFSPVLIGGQAGWYGLGPVSVLPEWQRRDIGGALIREGLDLLRAQDAGGCVVLGEPDYYRRFGFLSDPALSYLGYQTPYRQRLVLSGQPMTGAVVYHSAFDTP